jgi:cell shape-determining protein MreC
MLAYYTTIVKKEDLVKKLAEDGNNLSSLVNDLVCELKSFTISCSDRDVETSLERIAVSEQLLKTVTATFNNLKSNYESYVSSLVPRTEQVEQAEEKIPEEKVNKQESEQDIASLMEAVKTLKDLKDSLGQ